MSLESSLEIINSANAEKNEDIEETIIQSNPPTVVKPRGAKISARAMKIVILKPSRVRVLRVCIPSVSNDDFCRCECLSNIIIIGGELNGILVLYDV